MPKGLHDIPSDEMRKRLQERIDAASEEAYDAILLGYGLCNNGLVGVAARTVPLILPRAHDCITCFLGSRARYQTYFDRHPGTFFRTSGWIERDTIDDELKPLSIPHQTGMDLSYEQLVDQYGEDNAEFLWEELCDTKRNYSQVTFIEMGVEPDDRFEKLAQAEADENGWAFKKEKGDLSLLRALIEAAWNRDEFLQIPPEHRIRTTNDSTIITCEPILTGSKLEK